MGDKLLEISADKKKILSQLGKRMVIFVVGGLMCFVAAFNAAEPNYLMEAVFSALLLLYAVSPLRHFTDKLSFYEGRIVLNTKEILFDDAKEIIWMDERTYFAGERLKMFKKDKNASAAKSIFGSKNELDVTYMDRPKEQFIECYLNQA